MERSHRIRASVFEVSFSGLSHLRTRDGVVSDCIAHEFGKAMRLHSSICVNFQAVTVYFYHVAVDDDIALDQLQMNFECFRITGKCGG